MTTTPKQLLTPLIEHKAGRHLERIGELLEWEGQPIFLGECWAFPNFLVAELQPAYRFVQSHPPSDYPDAPALKVLSNLFDTIFPSPLTWHLYLKVRITEDRATAWNEAQQIYLERTGL